MTAKPLLHANSFLRPKWLSGPRNSFAFSSARPDFPLIRLHIEFSDNSRLAVVLPIGVVVVLVSSGSRGSSCRQSGDKAHPTVEKVSRCALSCCLGLLLLAHTPDRPLSLSSPVRPVTTGSGRQCAPMVGGRES